MTIDPRLIMAENDSLKNELNLLKKDRCDSILTLRSAIDALANKNIGRIAEETTLTLLTSALEMAKNRAPTPREPWKSAMEKLSAKLKIGELTAEERDALSLYVTMLLNENDLLCGRMTK